MHKPGQWLENRNRSKKQIFIVIENKLNNFLESEDEKEVWVLFSFNRFRFLLNIRHTCV